MIRNNYFSEEEINVTTIDGDRRELKSLLKKLIGMFNYLTINEC